MTIKNLLVLAFLLGYCLGFGQFKPQQDITSCVACGIGNIVVADLDNDGKKDIISTSGVGKVAWYKNLGLNLFSEQIIISGHLKQGAYLNYADLNNDSWIDIITVSRSDNKIIWYENEGNGQFAEEKTIAAYNGHFSQMYIDDYDNDSDVDLIANMGRDIMIYENNGNGEFEALLMFQGNNFSSKTMYLEDVTGDGDNDIVVIPTLRKKVYKYENTGQGSFENYSLIFELRGHRPKSLSFDDIDNDGYVDFLHSADAGETIIMWHKNNGDSTYLSQEEIIDHRVSMGSFHVIDFDNDNDLDVIPKLSTVSTKPNWYQNEGNGKFLAKKLNLPKTPHLWKSRLDYINGDDNLDMIFYKGNTIFWMENSGNGNVINEHIVVKSPLRWPSTVETIDVNNDNHLDIITNTITDKELVIYLNEGNNSFWESNRIDYDVDNITQIDVDIDGFMDIATYSSSNGEVLIFRNDGRGNLDRADTVAIDMYTVEDIIVGDINNDGYDDIVVAATGRNSIIWYENSQDGQFLAGKTATSSTNGVNKLSIIDLDGDSDLDIISSSHWDDKIAWHENLDNGSSFSSHIISTEADFANYVFAIDISGDGLPDVLSVSRFDKKIAWYKNLGHQGFSSEIIISIKANPVSLIEAADFDGDGDNDVVTTITNDNGNGGKIVWYENDGVGNFNEPIQISPDFAYPNDLKIVDLDKDNDLDLIFVYDHEDKITWNENIFNHPSIQGTVFWDKNGNGIFDSTEIILTNLNVQVNPDATSSYTDFEGTFKFYLPNGIYTLSVEEPNSCYQLTTDSLSYTVTIDGDVALNKNFGFQLASDYQHTQTRINSTATRCGFDVPFKVSVQNDGCVPSQGQYGLVLDSLVTLVETAIEPSEIRGDTLLWNYEELFSTQSESIMLTLQIAGTEFLGNFIHLTGLSYIENEAGELELSSTYDYTSEIRCAYDPNDKLVYPNRLGDYDKNYTLFEEELEYTVRFQNTGTDTAFTVVIKDYLDPNLNWKTFKPVVSSHPHETLLHPDGLVEFTFKNILLPDSTTNEPLSHGFVTYKIKPNADLAENTNIENTANIFFDFNPPIETNTTSNVLVEELPKATSTRTTTKATFPIKVYPNPFEEILTFELEQFQAAILEIFDARGQLIRTASIQNRIHQEAMRDLPNGLYFYRLLSQEKQQVLVSGRVVKQ